MKKLFYFTLLVLIISCDPSIGEKRIIAEYEPQEMIFIGLRTDSSYYSEDEKLNTLIAWDSLNLDIAKLCQEFVKVNLIVSDSTVFQNAEARLLAYGLDTSRVKIFYQNPTKGFYRDPTPLFGMDEKGSLFAVDFNWTSYDNINHPDSIREKAIKEERIDADLADKLGIPTIKLDLAFEGGAFENNGQGAVILTEVLMKGRNPDKSLQDIEKELKEKLNIKQVIWLPKGAAEDPQKWHVYKRGFIGLGTGGHTDEYVRFANDTTILLAWVEEYEKNRHFIDSMNYANYNECYNILSNTSRPDGRKYTIIKVPSAPVLEDVQIADTTNGWTQKELEWAGVSQGDTIIQIAASSYLNYVITNNLLIIPSYSEQTKGSESIKKDREVFEIFREIFPNHEIRQMNPSLFNWRGGGLHCRYKELPAVD